MVTPVFDTERRQWGPIERGVRHLGLDLADPETRVLLAIAAFADEGPAELRSIQIARRCGVDLGRIEPAIARLVRRGLLDVTDPAPHRTDARRMRPLVEPIEPIEPQSKGPMQ